MPGTTQAAGPGDRRAFLPRLTLRIRLTIWVVAIFSLILWSTGLVYWLYQRSAIREMNRSMLLEKAEEMAEPIAPLLPGIPARTLEGVARERLRWGWFGQYRVGVYAEDGASEVSDPEIRLEISLETIRRVAQTNEPEFLTQSPNRAEAPQQESIAWNTIYYPLVDEGRRYVLVIAVTSSYTHDQIALMERILLLAGLIGPIAAGIAGWFIAGIAVAPLQRLRGIARQLGPESINEALPVDGEGDPELDRLTQEIEDARQRIHHAFQAQERFLSNVSHEIKTPISVLLVDAQTLQTDGWPQEAREFVASAEEEMSRLGRLVEGFLTLTRVRDGKGRTRELELPANDLVMESFEHCLPMAQQYGVRLHPSLLDAEDEVDTNLMGEPALLQSMLDNLVRNAIRFSPEEGTVEIALERAGQVVRLSVRDRGKGIPEGRLDQIFDRFAQAPEERRRGRGHGLGLEIAQGIAELHGGSIRAENRSGGGAAFIVTLPVSGPTDGPEEDGEVQDEAEAPSADA
jgi:signal transduction histidine kinase